MEGLKEIREKIFKKNKECLFKKLSDVLHNKNSWKELNKNKEEIRGLAIDRDNIIKEARNGKK